MKLVHAGLIGAAAFAALSQASAQTITIQPSGPPAARVAGVVQRVETSMSFVLPGPAPATAEEMKGRSEAARRALYEMAANECATLSEVFRAECRLVSVRANSSIQTRGSGNEAVQANGQASFELSPRN